MGDKPRLVIPGDEPRQMAGSPQLERLQERAEVTLFDNRPTTIEEQVERAKDAELLINSRGQVKWPAEALQQLPKLKMISTCSIGTDSIDLATAREQGIVVSNIPGKTAPVVAEHAFALMMAVSKRVAYQTKELKEGRWAQPKNVYMNGKTLGVIGTGSIGAVMCRLARAIGMNVIAWTFNPSDERAAELGVTFCDLPTLLKESDVISVHVRYSTDSHQLIGADQLAQMKPGTLLINTARGNVMDNAAVAESLQQGHLGGVGLDVFEVEPVPADHPIMACEQVVLTPHCADQTPEGAELLNLGAVDNVLAYLDGQPQNVVT